MTARNTPTSPFRFVFAIALAVVAVATTANDARAACFTNAPPARIALPQLQAQRTAAQAFAAQSARSGGAQVSDRDRDDDNGSHQIVGMWLAEFRTNAGQLWDQGFELFHADGTELAVDNAVPPILGNVCVGVWKSIGGRTIKLRHMTWNWNPDGTPAGTFLLLVTATVSRNGKAYEGKFESDSFDTEGNVIPDFHAEGTVKGTRITVD